MRYPSIPELHGHLKERYSGIHEIPGCCRIGVPGIPTVPGLPISDNNTRVPPCFYLTLDDQSFVHITDIPGRGSSKTGPLRCRTPPLEKCFERTLPFVKVTFFLCNVGVLKGGSTVLYTVRCSHLPDAVRFCFWKLYLFPRDSPTWCRTSAVHVKPCSCAPSNRLEEASAVPRVQGNT